MSLSKRQKMLLGVFLVGLVGLVADRTVLRPQGGPQAASAESSAPNAPARSASALADGSSPPRVPLAERLKKLLPDQEDGTVKLRDPFSLPVTWPGSRAADGEKAPDAAGAFARKHQLRAVVEQGQEVRAQVDDTFLVPGQTIDGFRLVSVDYRSAVFEGEGKQVTLDLVVK